jgi:hypothetical protein
MTTRRPVIFNVKTSGHQSISWWAGKLDLPEFIPYIEAGYAEIVLDALSEIWVPEDMLRVTSSALKSDDFTL